MGAPAQHLRAHLVRMRHPGGWRPSRGRDLRTSRTPQDELFLAEVRDDEDAGAERLYVRRQLKHRIVDALPFDLGDA
jgi:hypothetical protein